MRHNNNTVKSRVSNWANDHFIGIMLVPALIALLGIFVYPITRLIWQSFHISVLGGGLEFSGVENYIRLLNSDQVSTYFEFTLIYSILSLIISIIFGMLFSLALNKVRNNRIRTIYSSLLLMGWAIPLAVVALMWRWMFNGEIGLINQILVDLGILASGYSWLASGLSAKLVVILVDSWIRIPFATIILLAGLQSIPKHMYDAASADGATPLQTFQAVTLPHLRPSLAIVGLINWMFSFRAFTIIYNMTNGGPGTKTQVLATYIFETGINSRQIGYAASISVGLVVVSLIVAGLIFKYVMTGVEGQ